MFVLVVDPEVRMKEFAIYISGDCDTFLNIVECYLFTVFLE